MPSADPMGSVGYLIAAAAVTLLAIAGYALMLSRWINDARARNARLRDEVRRERKG